MCGIAGILNRDGQPADPAILTRMAAAIAHRGPDGEGYFTDGGLGFGHRRLAIIDLSDNAAQPMATTDGYYVIAYNGEVYNFRELRAELEALNYRFRSRSDTEVVLNAFVEWGEKALERLNGMFAFAIWDRRLKRLTLARDRYGIKPLYYAVRNGAFLFGSEIKALLAHPAMAAEIDLEALLEYFTFQNFFTDRTLFKDVRLLPAGCSMTVAASADTRPRTARYWNFDFREPEKALPDAAYQEELDRLFRQAVERNLIADVPVASYLSGGLDTGAIAAVAAARVGGLRTFTIGFDLASASGLELSFDEREPARHMAAHCRTDHHERVLRAGDMERCLKDLVWHLEEPRIGQSYPNFYAAELVSGLNKVVLSGSGGDELFGGYPWRYYRAVVNSDFEQYIDKYYVYWQRLIPNRVIHQVFRPVWPQVKHVWTRDIFRDVFATHLETLTRPEDYINHSLYFEAKTFLHGLLVVEDKLSMAHGVESRVPFLDNDLVDFAMSVPVGQKLGNLGEIVKLNENEPGSKTRRYFEKTRDGKLLLRKVMRRYVPEAVADREKQGFSGPDASWFKGDSIDFVRDRLFASNAAIYSFTDRKAVQSLVAEHLDGKVNRRLLIWSLLCVEEWCRTFLIGAANERTRSVPAKTAQA